MECIILAGGLGTRLQSVIGQKPKCMAMVAEKPFLYYLLEYLKKQNCKRVILSLGFKHEEVTEWVESTELPFEPDYAIEDQPLGTGGGIRHAMNQVQSEDVIVINGDTMFDVDLQEMMAFHQQKKAFVTISLKYLENFERYGTVDTDSFGVVTRFREKTPRLRGFINGGIYIIHRPTFLSRNLRERFSFEKDFLEQMVGLREFYGFKSEGYFIDIGVPEDYEKAQQDFDHLFPSAQ